MLTATKARERQEKIKPKFSSGEIQEVIDDIEKSILRVTSKDKDKKYVRYNLKNVDIAPLIKSEFEKPGIDFKVEQAGNLLIVNW